MLVGFSESLRKQESYKGSDGRHASTDDADVDLDNGPISNRIVIIYHMLASDKVPSFLISDEGCDHTCRIRSIPEVHKGLQA
jgi:hypothetical protein